MKNYPRPTARFSEALDFPEKHPHVFDLGSMVSIKDIEDESIVELQKSNLSHLGPFGYMNREWEDFKKEINSEDELHRYYSGVPTVMCFGEWGFCIVRKGEVVKKIVTIVT